MSSQQFKYRNHPKWMGEFDRDDAVWMREDALSRGQARRALADVIGCDFIECLVHIEWYVLAGGDMVKVPRYQPGAVRYYRGSMPVYPLQNVGTVTGRWSMGSSFLPSTTISHNVSVAQMDTKIMHDLLAHYRQNFALTDPKQVAKLCSVNY